MRAINKKRNRHYKGSRIKAVGKGILGNEKDYLGNEKDYLGNEKD